MVAFQILLADLSDELKVFPGVGVFFLGPASLSFDVDLTVGGFFCYFFGLD